MTVNIDDISHNPFSLNIFDYTYLKSSQDTEDQNLVLVTLIYMQGDCTAFKCS